MKLSHLNGWRAVEAVIRTGSLGAAAQELGVTTAAVGAQVRGLEERLGCLLFDRTPSGLQPTDSALRVASRLTDGLAALAAVQEELSGGDARQVSITVTQTFAETWLPRHLPDLFGRIPQIDLRLDTRWDVVDLNTSGHDFAIRFMATTDTGFDGEDLLPSGVVPVCTPEFATRYGLSELTGDLSGVPLVHVDVPTSDPDWCDWAAWSARTGIALAGDTEAPSYTLQGSGQRLAVSGMGLVLGGLSESLFAVAEGQLVMPLGRRSIVAARYWHRLIWPKGRRLGAAQKAFRDWAVAKAQQDRALTARLFGV